MSCDVLECASTQATRTLLKPCARVGELSCVHAAVCRSDVIEALRPSANSVCSLESEIREPLDEVNKVIISKFRDLRGRCIAI